MHPFALSRADDLAKAITAHAMDGQLAFIAGGTDLLGLMKDRAAHPERLLDINGLPDLAQIEALPDGGLRIGALARRLDKPDLAQLWFRAALAIEPGHAGAGAALADVVPATT